MSAWHDAVEVIESQITDLTNRNKELAPPPSTPCDARRVSQLSYADRETKKQKVRF